MSALYGINIESIFLRFVNILDLGAKRWEVRKDAVPLQNVANEDFALLHNPRGIIVQYIGNNHSKLS